MMVQASARLAAVLGRSVSIVQLFQYTTVRSLAAALAGPAARGEAQTIGESRERAQARADALARRSARTRSRTGAGGKDREVEK
jgi:hypothetical protein